jgi:flagellar basal-body rod protein FlgB
VPRPEIPGNPQGAPGHKSGMALAFHCGMDIRNFLFGSNTRQIVYKSMDASVLRGKAIAQNLANIQTPGYQRKEVNFEEQLAGALKAKLNAANTQDAHMPAGKGIDLSKINPFVFEPQDQTLPGEINNVDVDMEASKMAENQIYYEFLTKFVGFDKYNAAISGRGGA